MGEEIGLTVKVKTVGQPGTMDKLKQQTASSVQQGADKGLKNVKVPGPLAKFSTSGTGGPLKGMMGGLLGRLKGPAVNAASSPKEPLASEAPAKESKGTSGGNPLFKLMSALPFIGFMGKAGTGAEKAAAGAPGGLGKLLGPLAALTIIGQGIMEILAKSLGILTEASPMLRAQLRMLTQGFMMILRPIGDLIADLLRPVSFFFRLIGRSLIKQMAEARKKLKAEGIKGPAADAALLGMFPQMLMNAIGPALNNVDFGGMFGPIIDQIGTKVIPGMVQIILKYAPGAISQFLTKIVPGLVLIFLELAPILLPLLIVGLAIFAGLLLIGMELASVVFSGLLLVGAAIAALGFPVLLGIGLIVLVATLLALFGPQIWAFLVSLGEGIYNAIKGVPGMLMDLLTQAFNFLVGIGSWIWDTFTGIWTAELNVLLGLGQWLWDQITGLIQKALDVAGNVAGGVTNALGIHGDVIPGLHLFGDGGIVTGGSALSMINEKGGGEVVSPLGDLMSMIQTAVASSGGGSRDINLTVVMPGDAVRRAMLDGQDAYYRNKIQSRG